MILACAYLLARSRFLANLLANRDQALTGRRRQLILGLVFGLIASSEVIFPGMRSPYVFDTLVTCLAVLFAGRLGGAVCAGIVVLVSLPSTTAVTTEFTAFAVFLTGLVAALALKILPRVTPFAAALAGAAGQTCVVLTWKFVFPSVGLTPQTDLRFSSVPANALGILLIVLVLQDAQERAKSVELKLEAEHYRTLALTSELRAFRAQMQPHFLFNVLAAIAALCRIDPLRAEKIVLRLATLLRRNLEESPDSMTAIGRELEFVQAYLDIQRVRHERIECEVRCDATVRDVEVPAFSVQTLVENAYNHGFALGPARGKVLVVVKRSSKSIVIVVFDDGVGMSNEARRRALESADNAPHGLPIVDRQLRVQFGPRSRIRLFTSPGAGTVAAFRVPAVQSRLGQVA